MRQTGALKEENILYFEIVSICWIYFYFVFIGLFLKAKSWVYMENVCGLKNTTWKKVISAIGTFSFHFHVRFNIVNMFFWSEDAHRTFFPQVSPFRTAWLSGKESAWEMWVQSLGWEDPLEKEMATHSSILAWKSLELRSLAGYRTWCC